MHDMFFVDGRRVLEWAVQAVALTSCAKLQIYGGSIFGNLAQNYLMVNLPSNFDELWDKDASQGLITSAHLLTDITYLDVMQVMSKRQGMCSENVKIPFEH